MGKMTLHPQTTVSEVPSSTLFEFTISYDGRNLFVRAASSSERIEWMELIKIAIENLKGLYLFNQKIERKEKKNFFSCTFRKY